MSVTPLEPKLNLPKRAVPGWRASTPSVGSACAAWAASLCGSTKKLAPTSGSPAGGATGRASGLPGSRGIAGSSPRIVSTALFGEAMPIGEGPNSDTAMVLGTLCTPWSTIGTLNVSKATPTGKSSMPLTDEKSIGSTAVHSAGPHWTPSPSVM